MRASVPALDDDVLERVIAAARDCVDAATSGNVAAELAANRRFHFAILDHPDHPHLMRTMIDREEAPCSRDRAL